MLFETELASDSHPTNFQSNVFSAVRKLHGHSITRGLGI